MWPQNRINPTPDLVLVDINLPGVSGLDLVRRLRATPTLAALPVAIFSATDRPDEVQAGLEAGADFVLSKDLLGSPTAWLGRIEELLTEAARRRSGTQQGGRG